MKSYCVGLLIGLLVWNPVSASAQSETYIMHSSRLILAKEATGNRAVIQDGTAQNVSKLTLLPNDDGTLCIAYPADEGLLYLSLDGSWDARFLGDATTDKAHFTLETQADGKVKFRCKSNGKYLGTDGTSDGNHVYADKDGTKAQHLWRLAETTDESFPVDTLHYIINTASRLQRNEGWGVSLCWWANMCGKWSDKKIDEIVDWLVSPTGLNYNIFRYNIGGGDDPENRNCTQHHMGNGKGLRAEMEGFKDFSGDEYHWDRDAAQRKIMLKIHERRPDAIFEAFSNSAPYYMTYSGCVAGAKNANDDNLRPEYYEEFAHYLVDVCKYYYDNYGIVFKTLEPFNEPVTNYWSANGGQEGCHFSTQAQIDFLRILHPILRESGLPTVIAASDETSVSQSVTDFKAYADADILDLVGQWNTHTYSASTKARSQVGSLAREARKMLWQSEVGSGGSGIGGNLSLMQKAIDDIRYILPDAWLDWQYVEESGDQWCTVRGNFAQQTYQRVRSYYVHQQLTRFIPVGYRYVVSLKGSTLAAISPEADTLVMVAINTESDVQYHRASVLFAVPEAEIKAWRTSETENLAQVKGIAQLNEDGSICFSLPPLSITTLQIPLRESHETAEGIEPDVPYLILPQYNVEAALTANEDGTLTIEPVDRRPGQVWMLRGQDGAYTLQNMAGQYIYDGGSSYYMSVVATEEAASQVDVVSIEPYYFRIMTDAVKGFDLNGESYSTGTRVGHYAYGSSVAAGHRNWQLMRLPVEGGDEVNVCTTVFQTESAPVLRRYNLQGQLVGAGHRGIVIEVLADGTSRKRIIR